MTTDVRRTPAAAASSALAVGSSPRSTAVRARTFWGLLHDSPEGVLLPTAVETAEARAAAAEARIALLERPLARRDN